MIRKAIERGEALEALQTLNDFFKNIEAAHQNLLRLNTRAHRLKNDELTGGLYHEQQQVESNRITAATLYSCQEVEKLLLKYFPDIPVERSSESLDNQLIINLIDRYEQIEEIARGRSAVFFRGKEKFSDRKVMIRVIKELNLHSDADAPYQDPRVAKALNLRHRNIIRVLGCDLQNFPKHLILEHISGSSLDHLIGHIPFSANRCILLIKQLCEALYHLHINGIVHENIKPDKVLIDHELKPVISPFDIASSRSVTPGNDTSTHNLLYASPELLKGEITMPDYKSDQFSMGLLAYEIIAGKPLFCDTPRGQSPSNMQSLFENRLRFFAVKKHRRQLLSQLKVPRKLQSIIERMLAENPADRYPSMKEIIAELGKVKAQMDQAEEIALDSYERCCIANPNFTEDFYSKLFSNAPHSAEIAVFFAQEDDVENVHRRQKMLRIAIELLITSAREPGKLRRVLGIDKHRGIAPHLYASFIDTILSMVAEADYLWQRYEAESDDNPVRNAWQSIRSSSMRVVEQAVTGTTRA